MENDPENYDFSTVTPILTEFAKFLSEYTGIALGLCPEFGEKVLVLYLKKSFQLPPGTFIADELQHRQLSAVPEYCNAVNQAESVNEFTPINQSTPVGENHNVGQAELSDNEWYQGEAAHTIAGFQAPYFSREAPQSGSEFMALIGDDHIDYEKRSFYQYRDEADHEERSFYQHQDEANYHERSFYQYRDEAATITNTQASSRHQQAPRSANKVLPKKERNDRVKGSHVQEITTANSKRKAGSATKVLPRQERNDRVKGSRVRKITEASSQHKTRSATKVLPQKERNDRVKGSRVQEVTKASGAWRTGRSRNKKYESDVSRLHFYVLEERKFWRRGDRLHIPVYAPLHKNQKKPIEGKTVIMTYISGSPENKRANLWECRCVGVNDNRGTTVTAQNPTNFVDIVKEMGLEGPVRSKWSETVNVIRGERVVGTVTDLKAMALRGEDPDRWRSLQDV